MDVISDLQESILSTSLLCKLLDTTLVNQQTKLPKNMANYAENSEGQNPGEEFFKICLDLSKLQKTSDELEALRWLFSNERTNVLNAKSEPSSQNSNLLIKSSGSSKSKHLQDRKNILVSNIYHANGVEECDEKLKEETSFSEANGRANTNESAPDPLLSPFLGSGTHSHLRGSQQDEPSNRTAHSESTAIYSRDGGEAVG
ncbi:uncharacterized protein LOC110599881 isoform X2 [Manihot esculenta]|uniref:uncharacterized protein LOC110599881 isoform X2 n=1 Tax=Manihot esculenta TaxID=3983 RepID=UPI001CC5CBA3|nr:uncharacterized protein LOC110599881 isoform X2 [Manihot esculenta]